MDAARKMTTTTEDEQQAVVERDEAIRKVKAAIAASKKLKQKAAAEAGIIPTAKTAKLGEEKKKIVASATVMVAKKPINSFWSSHALKSGSIVHVGFRLRFTPANLESLKAIIPEKLFKKMRSDVYTAILFKQGEAQMSAWYTNNRASTIVYSPSSTSSSATASTSATAENKDTGTNVKYARVRSYYVDERQQVAVLVASVDSLNVYFTLCPGNIPLQSIKIKASSGQFGKAVELAERIVIPCIPYQALQE